MLLCVTTRYATGLLVDIQQVDIFSMTCVLELSAVHTWFLALF